MRIKCISTDCPGYAYYDPSNGGDQMALTALFTREVESKNLAMNQLSGQEFDTTVRNIVEAKSNKYNRTKSAYLTCDNTISPGPHTHAYQVPTK